MSERCFTEAHRLFQHRVEHRGKLAGRGVDDLQDFGGCGVLLTRFGKFSRALGKLGLAFGKLTFEIGYSLLGTG